RRRRRPLAAPLRAPPARPPPLRSLLRHAVHELRMALEQQGRFATASPPATVEGSRSGGCAGTPRPPTPAPRRSRLLGDREHVPWRLLLKSPVRGTGEWVRAYVEAPT